MQRAVAGMEPRCGAVDVLVNDAGCGPEGPPEEIPMEGGRPRLFFCSRGPQNAGGMRPDLDLSKPLGCDALVVGAGLGGLISAAILARRGWRVIVVDRARRIGGRGGATPRGGYWLDGGQRDGDDVGDLQVGWRYGQLAAQEAAVEVPLRVVEPTLRVHLLPGGSGGGPTRVFTGRWGARGFVRMATTVFGCPEAELPELSRLIARLADADEATRRKAIPQRIGEWLEESAVSHPVLRALLTMLSTIYCEHPERASLGRLMSFFAPRPDLPSLQAAYADHPEVGGMQGLCEPFARALEARGGRSCSVWPRPSCSSTRRDERWGWTEARARIERIVAYLGEFYRDLDACVEWSAWQRVQRPACLAWH
ncbi:MAG: NAD(P)-binding protein [Myxococcota bacterium]